MKTHPYHFADPQLGKLLKQFLDCCRLTGHEKLAAQIESEREIASGESLRGVFSFFSSVRVCSRCVVGIFDSATAAVGCSLDDVDEVKVIPFQSVTLSEEAHRRGISG